VVWLLVIAGENLTKAKKRKSKPELLTQIPE
jgi:hypothetical protein